MPLAAEQSAAGSFPSKAANGRPGAQDRVSWNAVLVCAFVAFTGFFHGYDNGVVSDVFTMPSFRAMMGWPEHDDAQVAFEKGLTVNGFNVGAAVSAVLCGHLLVDRHGRKPALILGSLLFALGGVVQTFTRTAVQLIVGRLVAGVGVGITSSAGPAYIAEVAPSQIRGAMVGIYQSNVCVAVLGAAVINYFDQDYMNGWRWSLGVQIVLGVVTAFGMLFVSETPRFLESIGRSSDALRVLTWLRKVDRDVAQQELDMVQAEIAQEKEVGIASWGELFSNPYFRNIVLIGCTLQFFQIITGINAMVSFGGTLFASLGARSLTSALTPSLAFLIGNAIGSFLLVDRLGRRSLLVWGMVGMGTTLLTGGIIDLVAPKHMEPDGQERIGDGCGYAIIAMIVGFMFSFGISWGFGVWLYISEIMPLRVRGKAVGLCTGVNWGPANVASAFITPMMIAGPMGPGGTLLFFGGVSMLVVPFAAMCLPETKGRTLEEVKPLFRFADCAGFRSFIRGNLRGGFGVVSPKEAGGPGAASRTMVTTNSSSGLDEDVLK